MHDHQSPTDELVRALEEYAPLYDVRLNRQAISQLRDYYEQVMSWNARLHLVAPCSPATFATRHLLESLLALPYFREGTRIVDVGSGAGLPIIPCLIVRPDLRATLIESSQKKAIFLREATRSLGLQGKVKILAGRFEELPAPEAEALTCRALERFAEVLPKLFAWSSAVGQLLLFGGEDLGVQIEKLAPIFKSVKAPESERRFLFVVKSGLKPKVQSQN